MAAYKRYVKKTAPQPAQRVLRNWSCYQQDIFQDMAYGQGNTHVEAKAGSGKTSSICEGFYYIPVGKESLMCAFAKPIQEELEKRAAGLPITVLTMHGLGYRTLLRAFPRINRQVDKNKLMGYIVAELGDDETNQDTREDLAAIIPLAKGYLAASSEEFDEIMDRHSVGTGSESRDNFISLAIKIMNATGKDTNRMDFDDMVWLPLIHNLSLTKFDRVLIDEAQDLNKAQIEMALASVKDNGRILTVGDTNQAIFAFRGADSNAIGNIINRLNSKVLPLSVTYRCATAIVELAKTLVPELEAAPNAEKGLVANISVNEIIESARPGDFILSRTNAPLMRYCLDLLKSGVRANIMGRDLGDNFLFMIKRSRASSVEGFMEWAEEWRSTEVDRLNSKKRDSSLVQDKFECLLTLAEGMTSLASLKNNIKELFHKNDDSKDRVILSTTHKAKGLERDRVFVLNSTYKPGKSQEESNLTYVAYTRAKKELYLAA
jgi:superfamily I DNA/RNA helicase